ncbi:tRNA(Ile)-lysidine synthase [Mizugakiibacter sediminis]|uniref:tRNA(Ile)-lysidine synthase n=1 Tax=Mizugakiibacter sediminis TaxID=1475481 RepID=A0A0K8QNQ0_9GAMM|nr:tRNA lysidine(34) synthetase TilS [Mizugakiibacter sediminis]GAP66525.1 tRNA(Ile)-lysidine synthase [Mizugakiibacter sediminis]
MVASLTACLQHALAARAAGPLCVGYSGGPDSTALLHALAALPEARARGLRALHVDHGLHADSARWAAHCRAFAAALQVPLAVVRVEVPRGRGEGLEAAAREARHAAFAAELREGETLVLAQHRDDQAETVLLKLLRGAGPEGLGGMRGERAFARGRLWRPLLALPRAALAGYVRAHALPCIEDPANADPALARSFLRREILPRLAQHWPQAPQAIAHAAAACRDAADYLVREAATARARLQGLDPATLDAAGWAALPAALRTPVLEGWLRELGLPAPARAQAAELLRQIETCAADRVPRIAWPGAELRLWRGLLYAMAPLPEAPRDWRTPWDGAALQLPAHGGVLTLEAEAPAPLDMPLEVRVGASGVRFKPAGDRHTRELRDLYQQAGVPPWQRARCPLIHAADGTLLAVADLWCSEAGATLFERLAARPRWMPGC